jgi:hypothetical protein
MYTRVFEIKFDDSLGPMWMNEDNLRSCLFTTNHIKDHLNVEVIDVTDELDEIATRVDIMIKE